MALKCKTLILDLDGTISDPSLGITRCFNHALQSHGFPIIPDATIKKEIGPPLDKTFLKLVPGICELDVAPLVSTYRERYSAVGYSENTLYPDMLLVLSKINTVGIGLGVCTSKPCSFAEKILSLFEIFDFFDFIDGGDIGITKTRQLSSLLKRGAIDSDSIMVGDRAIDITSAKENSLRSIGVLWGFGSHDEIFMASPTHTIKKVPELSMSVF